MGAIITLTTDFGLKDGYTAAVKGIILGINPQATIVDITHQVAPHDIYQAAFTLSTVYDYFPPPTIHLVIVDPGVGTARKAIILHTPVGYFIAPDNGVLSYVLRRLSGKLELRSGLAAIAITNSKYWHVPVSNTFHGRDILAPVAAHLSLGVSIKEFGRPLSSIAVLPLAEPCISPDGLLIGNIIYIDSFGNLITNIRETDLPDGKLVVTICDKTIIGLSSTYARGAKLLALIGSSGYLEIALREGSAAVYLEAKIGNKVAVRPEVK